MYRNKRKGSADMTACYKKMVNPKTEAAKLILFLSLTAFSGRIHDFLHSALAERYGGLNADYILRLLALLQLILILIYACRRFLLFCRKNCDSLLLLGIAGHRIPGLFFLANLPLFCLEIFLTAVLKPDFSGIGWSVILSGILNTFLILFGAILLMQSPLYKCRIFLPGAATIGAGGLLYASSLNYQSAYALLMQHPLSRFLFSQYHNFTFGKLAAALSLCALLLYLSGTRYPGTDQPEHAGKSANLAGDLWHRFGGRLIWKKNYLYLYRNADFVIWKLFSSFLLLIAWQSMGGTAPMLLLIYVLCLAAASYLPDSCQLESECRFIYLTSDRTYPEMLRGQIAGGTLLIGDNVLLILLFMRADPLSFLCALGSVLFLSAYLTNALCSGYPEHVSKISFIKAIAVMHIPLYSLIKALRDYRRGRDNWTNWKYIERNEKEKYS